MENVKALIFDVFGTLVDWRSSIARETKAILGPLGHQLDWPAFADAWRAEYDPAMQEVRSGKIPFCKLDVLHRRNLDVVLGRNGITLDEPTARHLNLAWHRLDAWPDTSPGLKRLKRKFMIAPCSNGNISLMVGLARRNDLPWDAILGSEIAHDFKPKARVYLAACEALDLPPNEVMMVAAHPRDLAHAASNGLRTGFIFRADEFGPGKSGKPPTEPVDVSSTSVEDLAGKLGA